MKSYRSLVRQNRALLTASRGTRQSVRHITNRRRQPEGRKGGGLLKFVAIFALGAGAVYYYPVLFPKEEVPEIVKPVYQKAEIEFEKERAHPSSKEDNRDLISSQHLQVKHSWEHPGVYAWGSNVGKVIDPDSRDSYIKLPRRIAYFDGQILRDIKLTQSFGAAVTEKGDLVQWGLGFSKSDPAPIETLKGRDIVRIAVSDDRVLALSSNGSVYAVPASRADQGEGTDSKRSASSWVPFWSSGASPLPSSSIRNLTPANLGWGEKIVDVRSGLQHSLLLSSKGRVYSAASSTSAFPSKGQLGVPGLGWANRPSGPFDQPHELLSLKGFNITHIATGDYHSAVLDKEGKLFTFGDNTNGQLGIQAEGGFRTVDVPTLIPISQLYTNTGLFPKVTSIAAGGLNTFFTVDARRPSYQEDSNELAPARRMPTVTADVWACGSGIYGSLGNGKWTHVTPAPAKVKSLSALFEFDESKNQMVPIKLSNISVGSTHASATMANVTRTGATSRTSENDTNWGADVLFWGGNEHYQLGTGKRSNLNTPAYIGALDGGPASDFHRLQVTPRKSVRLGEDGKGRKATLEQRVECGRFVTAVYSST